MDDLPPLGSVIAAADVERWKHLLGPSVQWSLQHGATIKVSAPVPIPLEAARARATELYHDQVELTADKMDMKNYVAGVPFPTVNPDDPDAGVKLMFNQQSRTVVDDVDARNIACQTGTIVPGRGVELEKQYVTGHWRRLFYVGRLYYDPKPAWKASDGARYRESQYPFIEPFDLKSGGWSYTRYLDPGRLDDAWLYYPITRRVRRMSTAQRSQGVFGQDMDLDSLAGFSGNPAWTEWHLLGVKTVLAAMHAKHSPVGWQKAPADFVFDEEWEPRQVYVILGRSRLPDYGFSQRVIYVDRESYLIPYSEIYDLKGQLWKGLVQAWSFGATVRPDAGGASFEEFYLPGYAMIDMQLNHVTRCELPYRNAVGDKGWYYNHGNAEGVTEDSFAVSSLIGQAH
ncbi:MAG: DUF1329 domain-containing protein [Deltaproteobacteria bacterium]|nr:DUF1329 domain-containing protein [Deltaproteobacteria bacterium]